MEKIILIVEDDQELNKSLCYALEKEGYLTVPAFSLQEAKSKFVERFPELSLFYRLFSPLNSEMICIFPYFCPYAESAREIREIFS